MIFKVKASKFAGFLFVNFLRLKITLGTIID
jgi:hypothetical protein